VSWTGWLGDDAWERVCSAPTIGEAARELGCIGERRGVPTWLQVRTGGGTPRSVPAGMRQPASAASGRVETTSAPSAGGMRPRHRF